MAAGHLVALPGAADSSLEPDAGADPVGSARSLWQASRILGLITAFIAAGGATLLGACLVCGWLPQPTFKPLALLLLGLGVLLCFATSAGITRAIMLLVPVPMRGFAIGVETLGLHAFGDVPAPLVVGAVKDTLAPGCNMCHAHAGDEGWCLANATEAELMANDTVTILNPECRASVDDQAGLRFTLLATGLWILWAAICWFLGYLVLRRRTRRALLAESAQGIA